MLVTVQNGTRCALYLALVAFSIFVPLSSRPAFAARNLSTISLSSASARYLNPNTGRFWTADSYEGRRIQPLSLHKYLYCQDSPINRIDPSGHDGDVISLGGALDIGAGIDAMRLPAISAAFVRTVALIGSIALTLTLEDTPYGRLLYHYDVLDEYQVTGFPPGTWLTDRGDLSFSEALNITFQSGSRLFVYGVYIKSLGEIQPFPPIRPGVNQWRSTAYLPPIRVNILRTLYGPNWSGPTE